MKKVFLIIAVLSFAICKSQTLAYVCGFECGQGQQSTLHLTSKIGTLDFNTTTKRNGSRSLHTATGAENDYLTTALSSSNIFVGRIAIRFTTLPNGVQCFFEPFDGAQSAAGVYFDNSDSKLKPGYGGISPTMGSNGASVTTGVWYVVDIKVDMSNNPWTIDMKVDGTALNQLTAAIAANTYTQTYVGTTIGNAGNPTTQEVFLDDMVISQTAGDYPIGDGFVYHYISSSDGTHNTGSAGTFIRGTAGANITNSTTDSYLLVDDIPLDGTTVTANDFITQATNGSTNYTENVFAIFSGGSDPSYAPQAFDIIVEYHEAGTGAGVSAIKLNDNGTENSIWDVGSAAGVTTGRYTRKNYATMVGGGAWTNSRFDALKIRFGYSSDANPDQYFDCAMIEAAYNATAPAAPNPQPFGLMGVSHGTASIMFEKIVPKKKSNPTRKPDYKIFQTLFDNRIYCS